MKNFEVYLKRKTFFGKRIKVYIRADGAEISACDGWYLEFYKTTTLEHSGEIRTVIALFNRGEWLYYTQII